jgi:RNA recognition motif-containing protein
MCLFVCSLNAAQEFEGRVINLKYARPKKEKTLPSAERTLFVGNLSFGTRAKDLREFFDSGTSKVVSADVVFRAAGSYGFVSFKTKKEADEALSEFQGKVTHSFLHQFIYLNSDSWECVTSFSQIYFASSCSSEKTIFNCYCDIGKIDFLQILLGRPIRVAPGKRTVKPTEESAGSEDTSSESSVNEEAEVNKAD